VALGNFYSGFWLLYVIGLAAFFVGFGYPAKPRENLKNVTPRNTKNRKMKFQIRFKVLLSLIRYL